MKINKTMTMVFIVLMAASICWGQTYWKRTYYDRKGCSAGAILPDSDKNFIVVGSSFAQENDDVYILKINANGDTLWTKTYGGYGNEGALAIASSLGGNFIITGSFEALQMYVIKIKPNGDTLWIKNYGQTFEYSGFNVARDIAPCPDGNHIIVAKSNNAWAGKSDTLNIHLLKIKSNGDPIWSKIYNSTKSNDAYAITPMFDGNFIIGGVYSFGDSGDPNSYKIYLLKINSDGDTLWTKIYGEKGNYDEFSIVQTIDSNFIVAAVDYSSGNCHLLKIKANGDTCWTKTYSKLGISSIVPTDDGNFIAVGVNSENNNSYLVKIKSNGDTLWTNKIGGFQLFFPHAIAPTSNGNFLVIGNNYKVGSSIHDFSMLAVIDDGYASKDSLFTFKIPVSGDSLNSGYSPLKVPTGMSVNLGGTISWTPTTDSVYMDHAEFLVFDDKGKKDTLTFNIFVNSSYKPAAIKPAAHFNSTKNQTLSICQISPFQIKFTFPSGAHFLDIYDIRGRLVQRIIPKGASAVWNGIAQSGTSVPAGRYFAKISGGSASNTKAFMVVR